MTNRNETIIEQLHGRLAVYKGAADLLDGCTIYDETGHVDCDFFTAILEFLAESSSVELSVHKALSKMLGIEETDGNAGKKDKADTGTRWTAEEILKHCTLEDNVLKLPAVQFNKKSYLEAKKWIEEAGGQWKGGKVQGFTFPFNAERVFSILHTGKRCNLQQDFQFFETPAEVADWLVMLAGGISPEDSVLEPSAGRGALVKAIHRSCPDVIVDCYELMPENREILSGLGNVRLSGSDFMAECSGTYTKIIANPPFSGNQDIRHIMQMYGHLADGGTLAAIAGTHWKFGAEETCRQFREWLDGKGAEVHDIASGEFKESGTTIPTTAIIIKR